MIGDSRWQNGLGPKLLIHYYMFHAWLPKCTITVHPCPRVSYMPFGLLSHVVSLVVAEITLFNFISPKRLFASRVSLLSIGSAVSQHYTHRTRPLPPLRARIDISNIIHQMRHNEYSTMWKMNFDFVFKGKYRRRSSKCDSQHEGPKRHLLMQPKCVIASSSCATHHIT